MGDRKRGRSRSKDPRTIHLQLKLNKREAKRVADHLAYLVELDGKAPPKARWAREVVLRETEYARDEEVAGLQGRIEALERDKKRLQRDLAAARWQVKSLVCERTEGAATPSRSEVDAELRSG